MTVRTYRVALNACFAAATIAVLLFDRVGHLSWLPGGVLLVSMILAVALHLRSQWHPPRNSLMRRHRRPRHDVRQFNIEIAHHDL